MVTKRSHILKQTCSWKLDDEKDLGDYEEFQYYRVSEMHKEYCIATVHINDSMPVYRWYSIQIVYSVKLSISKRLLKLFEFVCPNPEKKF